MSKEINTNIGSYKKAIYSGTFDPITNGHLDIIKRATNIFDEVVIAVAKSELKKPMFSHEQRVAFVEAATSDLEGVKVLGFDTLLVDLAASLEINTIIRGLRAVSDFEFELQMGYANSSINKKLETLYLMPTLENAFVSSTIVREIIRFNGKFEHLVPARVVQCM
ncbi:pantetheine-phosphate adenylyltransferase [Aliarcobacter butzleri]|uniref:Phosphopantetheine adenylyltransferase n=2 Tax=Aliarcobacter butzleri TaxID=28197 RepID=A0AAW7PQX1_9BACT|nr:pantetheine-phosphate adenylyltransferase [Aliarcobacter butzleri]AGR77274.1 phosphopantetheine adenylyltransferase [Aliarcobacter butzleri 7h1h]KLE03058.1 phosphopantetheine adenylyltransferase [Aliarcobacter butzleri L352]MCG3677875.1 pantetheine-phosphate adenylyltransferase [Aliarcobacter butzleri]MCG3682757.1 pantetheine-phosphate adenylyltransferase [Aliarcobacter butzleri]MCG3703142.1 pantetheine-phosphate adenylyltransferase [Aliarcobacter butzleri]